MPQQEGVIKFQLDFTPAPPLPAAPLAELQSWRTTLYQHKLIGQDPARYGGYGYGNLSHRLAPYDAPPHLRTFVISGSQTGDLAQLGPEHYAVVDACYSTENRIVAHGPIRPSSESLTHGAVYDLDPAIRCVLHVHSPEIWRRAAQLDLPTTLASVPYGSPEMASEVARLYAESDLYLQRIFSMGGHEDGIVAFGPSAESAGETLLAVWRQGPKLDRRRDATRVTVPVPPSTTTSSPSTSQLSAPAAATTAGMPNSRATIAACESRLPRSTTSPPASGSTRIQLGSVCSATMMSPCSSLAVNGSRTKRTRPCTRPGAAPTAFN